MSLTNKIKCFWSRVEMMQVQTIGRFVHFDFSREGYKDLSVVVQDVETLTQIKEMLEGAIEAARRQDAAEAAEDDAEETISA